MKSTIDQFLKAGGVSLVALLLVLSLSHTSRAQTASPNAPSIVRQGYTLLQRGWVGDAIATFRQAVQRYPQSVDAQLGLAIAYQRQGEDSNAWQAYQRVLQLDPANRSALSAVGTLGGYRPEWQRQGIAALTQLLELNPADNSARAQRALLYGYQGQFLESLADYDVVLAANPTPEVMLGAAQIYSFSGNFAQSVEWFDRYQATGNRIPVNAISAYALALQETGNPQQAIALLEPQLASLTTLNDTALQVRSALAVAYQANGQTQAALAVLQPLRDRENAVLPLARALSTIGRESGDMGLYDEAIDLYRQSLAATPNPSAGFLTEVADVLSESPSARTEALQLYGRAIEQQPSNRSLQVKRSIVESQLG
ncbi:MAG: tetratricopeptide repeat protein [Leptolyngbyaceae cyanobacterium SL_7_1]|nr:tetratricopeptide repeat protein [Leptolyngbyaceae cyanobacterium SL_7_1]